MLMTGATATNRAPARIRLPSPHPGQRAVRKQARRFNWLAAGRRWRKTTLFMAIAAEACATRNITAIWGAPTFDQVRIGFSEMQKAAGAFASFNMSRMTCDFPGAGRIFYRSMDSADNVRGYTADMVFIDEAGFIKSDVWASVLRPMLIDTGGDLWAGGTPFGKNWFYIEHMRSIDREDSAAWQAPTLGVRITESGLVRDPHPLENPNISFDEIKQLYATTPQRLFEQEILALFNDSGGVFNRVEEAAVASFLENGEPGRYYVIGVDWGRENDFTVFAVIDIESRSMVHMSRFTQIDYEIQTSRLRNLHARFPGHIIAEYNAMGGPIVERLRSEDLPIIPFVTTGGKTGTKEQIIRGLENAFDNGDIAILDHEILKAELKAYQQERLDGGGWKFGAPEGMHDDTVIALALAWSAVGNLGTSVMGMY